MVSALSRKSITDLSRRRSRTCFSVVTLALAVASIGLFALPTLMNRAMRAAVTADRLPDLTVYMRPLPLDSAQLEVLRRLPNVSAVQPSSFFGGRVYGGYRRASVEVRGVLDFAHQRVNVVHVASGDAPGPGAVLTDVQNADQGLLSVGAGGVARIIGADGATRALGVSGEGRNLSGGQDAAADGVIVFYATVQTVASLSGVHGFDTLAFRLADTRPAAVSATVAAVRRRLAAVPGFAGFSDLPVVRAAGDWPGKSSFDTFTKFFYVITLLALLAALVLISNTISTLVGEQTWEIAIMEAIGARRRQVAAVYLKTALLLGAGATVLGVVLGLAIANLLVSAFGNTFAVNTGFGVAAWILLVSVLVGLIAPPLAALPSIRRAVRLPLREALQAVGSAVGNEDAGDRLLRGIRFLPRTMQIGLRNAGRRRRRSLATACSIAFAVGSLVAVLCLAAGIAQTSRTSWGDHGEDVRISSEGRHPLDAEAARLISSTPGVARIEPTFVTDVKLAGKDARIWAVHQATMFHYRISAGRWFTPSEERARARVAVVEADIAGATGAKLGHKIQVETASGPVSLRVVGISANQQENGTALYAPLSTMHALLRGVPAAANDYWVQTTSHDHTFVDRITTRIEDTLTNHGYDVSSEIKYVKLNNEINGYRALTNTIVLLGFLIVAISMAGLANALTMSVLERTREIGILRSIGAHARDIRRIFAAETLAIALTGWLIAIPLAYLLTRFLVWLVKQVANVTIPFAFPAWYLIPALAGTILLALLITLLPIGRAVRYKPGDALRYT